MVRAVHVYGEPVWRTRRVDKGTKATVQEGLSPAPEGDNGSSMPAIPCVRRAGVELPSISSPYSTKPLGSGVDDTASRPWL